jgi:hypothetical protein
MQKSKPNGILTESQRIKKLTEEQHKLTSEIDRRVTAIESYEKAKSISQSEFELKREITMIKGKERKECIWQEVNSKGEFVSWIVRKYNPDRIYWGFQSIEEAVEFGKKNVKN